MDKPESLFLEQQRLKEDLQRADTSALIAVTEMFGDELLRRAHAATDPRAKHVLHLTTCNVIEVRGRLRLIRAYEQGLNPPSLFSPAVSLSDPQHGAAQPEASTSAQAASTTNGTAGGSTCSRCLHSEGLHVSDGARLCMSLPPGQAKKPTHEQWVYCDCPGFVARDDSAPSTPSPRSADAAGGAARAEGAAGEGSEADRAKSSAPAAWDLSPHLKVLKGGG